MALSSYYIIVAAALAGFFIAFYIRQQKLAGKAPVCPLKADCHSVIFSEYSKFFGIPIEPLGMLYYGLIAVLYGTFAVAPQLATIYIVFLVTGITVAAFLFSLYLTFIQGMLLRQWCSWCLMSAGLCAVIFFMVIASSRFTFTELLAVHHTLILIFHFIGVALGLGGATVADLLFFKFIKDGRISDWEADVLRQLSQIIWAALAVLIITGVGLYLPAADFYNQSAWFLAKIIIVGVIIVSGAFLNLYLMPRLINISLGGRHQHEMGELRRLRRFAFTLGATSFVSWYSAFILGMIGHSAPRALGVGMILGIYLAAVGLAILIGLFVENLREPPRTPKNI